VIHFEYENEKKKEKFVVQSTGAQVLAVGTAGGSPREEARGCLVLGTAGARWSQGTHLRPRLSPSAVLVAPLGEHSNKGIHQRERGVANKKSEK